MKIKINQFLTDVDGETPIIEKGNVLTLKDIIIGAVLTPMQEDDQKKKFEKWDLFKKVRGDVGVVEAGTLPVTHPHYTVSLTSEEIVLIKTGIGKIYPPLILGQAFEMLEGEGV